MKLSEIIKKYSWEIITFIIFCIGTITLSFFHEPWFDEFQAWGIAKDSIYNILFVIPHYESHPPLWHLIIKFFQQFTTNPELAIKIPNLMIMFTAVWLLIFKSPFPKKIRLVLPFTFFIFYQYTIVSRPYCLLVLGMFLAAVLYKSKNDHPFRFISILALLVLSSAHGLVLAAGITLAWCVEIAGEKEICAFIKSFVKDKRFYGMLALFFLCLGISIIIKPIGQQVGTSAILFLPIWQKILYSYFCLPADATISNILSYNGFYTFIHLPILISGVFIGMIINMMFVIIFKKNKFLPAFIIPYILLLTFFCCIYIAPHHIGILTVFYIYAFWCLYDNTDVQIDSKYKKFCCIFLAIIMVTEIMWSICSAINEIKYQYAISREAATYIKKHNLENKRIFAQWGIKKELYGHDKKLIDPVKYKRPIFEEDIWYKEVTEITNVMWDPATINPYFGKNIFSNYNVLHPNKLYNIHNTNTDTENKLVKDMWKNEGEADVFIGIMIPNEVYSSVFDYSKYSPMEFLQYGWIWKTNYIKRTKAIFIKKDKKTQYEAQND